MIPKTMSFLFARRHTPNAALKRDAVKTQYSLAFRRVSLGLSK